MTKTTSIPAKRKRNASRSRNRPSTRKQSRLSSVTLHKPNETLGNPQARQRTRRSTWYAHTAHRNKRAQWALIAQQTARVVLGDGKYVETRRVPVVSTLADMSKTPQPSPTTTMRTWHIVHDIAAQVRHSVLSTTFYPATQDLPKPRASTHSSTSFEFSKNSVLSVIFAGQFDIQCGFGTLNILISSLTSTSAQPFFTSLKNQAKLDDPTIVALSTDAMLYSPSIVASNDDFDGELDAIPADPTTKDLEVPPAINAQSQRAMGEHVSPYFMNVLSAAPVHVGPFSSACSSSDPETKCIVRQTIKSRVARALRLFAARGDTTLVLCAFGCEEGTPIDTIAEVYAELLACSSIAGDVGDGEFRDVFEKVVFAIPRKLYSTFRKTFEMRVYEDELIHSLEGN
ncbi:hypothetical protein BGW80DRAFT_1251851 [Lactifluus volemus]|nr:hypothetical protein BGW80DRAFT_1251851 [Lactifluus volemus]